MMPLVFTDATPVLLVGREPAFAKRRALLEASGLTLTLHEIVPDDAALDAARLIFGAGLSVEEGEALAAAARARSMPVNIEDVPHLCDVHVPAMIRRGDLLLTVSTGGGAPAMAAAVRAWLDQRFGPEWEDRLHEMGTTDPRNRLHNKHPNLALDHHESQREPHRQGGADWTPITSLTGSLFHAYSQAE